MWYDKRAIETSTIANFNMFSGLCHIFVMTTLAEVMSAIAKENCNTAAEKTFPVNVFWAVLLAYSLSGPKCLYLAFWAHQVFLFSLGLLDAERSYAILHATKIGFFALKALVKGTWVHSESQQVTIKRGKLVALVKSLIFCHFDSHLMHFSF